MHRACRAVDVDKHPIGIILKNTGGTIEGVRFELSRDHWSGVPATFAKLPARVVGRLDRWGHGGRNGNKVVVNWETDGTNSTEHLCVILRARLGLKLLPYANGASAPKAKGAAAQREYKTAMTTGPYAPASGAGAGEGDTVEVRRRVPKRAPRASPAHAHTRRPVPLTTTPPAHASLLPTGSLRGVGV